MRILPQSLLAIAVLLCAWFAVGIRQASEIDRATNVIQLGTSANRGALSVAASHLDSAEFLHPGQDLAILRARLAIAENQAGRARGILEAVTRAEPLNLEGWIWLAGASLSDRREATIALAHIAQLDPRDAASSG